MLGEVGQQNDVAAGQRADDAAVPQLRQPDDRIGSRIQAVPHLMRCRRCASSRPAIPNSSSNSSRTSRCRSSSLIQGRAPEHTHSTAAGTGRASGLKTGPSRRWPAPATPAAAYLACGLRLASIAACTPAIASLCDTFGRGFAQSPRDRAALARNQSACALASKALPIRAEASGLTRFAFSVTASKLAALTLSCEMPTSFS